MFRAKRAVYHRRRRHRYQSSSDDDSNSSSSSSSASSSSHFSDDEEEIDVESISSSSLSAASASAVDGEDLVQEMTLSSDSEESDDEERGYGEKEYKGDKSLEKAIVMVERLDDHELLHVQQHISKLISTKTPKAVQRRLPAPSSPPNSLYRIKCGNSITSSSPPSIVCGCMQPPYSFPNQLSLAYSLHETDMIHSSPMAN